MLEAMGERDDVKLQEYRKFVDFMKKVHFTPQKRTTEKNTNWNTQTR